MIFMHFHEAQMSLYFGTFFRVQGGGGGGSQEIIWHQSKNCPGVQGRSN